MPYYNDPSGNGSWWVDEGQTPGQARQYWQDVSGQQGGAPNAPLTTTPEAYTPTPAQQQQLALTAKAKETPAPASASGFTINGKPGVFAYKWPDGHISSVSDIGNKDFASAQEFEQALKGAPVAYASSPEQAIAAVQAYTGDAKYNGSANPQFAQGSAAQTGTNFNDWYGASRSLKLQMPDGSTQVLQVTARDLSGQANPQLQQALKAGGKPIDAYGKPMSETPGVYGGSLWTDSQGNAMPLNVTAGFGWLPGQQEAMANYYAAGWKPGSPALTNPPPLSKTSLDYIKAQGTDPATVPDAGGDSGMGAFGSLAQTFDEKFQSPTGQDVLQHDPGYQFRLQQGMDQLQRQAAARGTLTNGGTLKELTQYGQDYASGEYQNAWQRAMQEYAQRRDVFRGNQNDVFGRFATLAGLGNNAAQATASYGTNAANAAANIYGQTARTIGDLGTSGANAQAAAAIAAGNNWNNTFENLSMLTGPYGPYGRNSGYGGRV